MRPSPIRFTGMASGMDTDSIVKDMMRPQQYKIDQEKKAQALVKLKQDAWKDMNKRLSDFHRNFTSKLSLESTYNNRITTTSNPDAIEITNKTKVPGGRHEINIIQLATATYVEGTIKTDKITDGKLLPGTTVGQLMGVVGDEPEVYVLKMQVNKKDIVVEVKSGDTLKSVASAMNKVLGKEGFTARYDEISGGFYINSNKLGANQTIEFSHTGDANDVSPLFEQLGLKEPRVKDLGKGSQYTYNGGAVIDGETNQIQINGIQATLKAANTGPITIASVQDPDATYDFIKEFITEYNNLIDEINQKISTKPGKDIMPLTSEEREAMSDSEIKLWEEKLNSSLFYKDPQLTEFVDNARSILSSLFGRDLADLGIVTGPWTERGKLHILGDEDDELHALKPNKLREALRENPQAVGDKFYEIGQKLYTDTNAKLIRGSALKSAMNFYNDKVMDEQVKTFDKRIETLEERMYKMEEMHYRKFAAMEKMLSTLNNQSSWLAQQFGGY